MKKNVASQVAGVQMTTIADGTPFTGTVTVYITGDNGSQTIGSVGSGICTHKGKGYHVYLPSQGETNYDHVAFTYEGTGAFTISVQEYPTTIIADIAAVQADTDNIQTRLPAALVSGLMSCDVTAISTSTTAADNLELAGLAYSVTRGLTGTALPAIASGSAGAVITSGTGTAQLTTSSGTVTVGTNSDKTGYRLSATGVDDILDEAITEPATVFLWASASLRTIIGWCGAIATNKTNQTATSQALRDRADSLNIASATVSDDGTTFVRGSWA